MQDITYYTKLILSPEVQTLIDPYRNVFILISVIFITISIFLIFQEKYYVAEVRRKVLDFLTDPKRFKKPIRFASLWQQVEKAFKKNNYKEMIKTDNKLMLQILKSFGYVGSDPCDIFSNYGVKEGGFPNIDNVIKICELEKSIRCGQDINLTQEEATLIYNLSKDTLIKIGILDK